MHLVLLLLYIMCCQTASSQSRENCSNFNLSKLKTPLVINGKNQSGLDSVFRSFFAKGLKLSIPLKEAKVIGFSVGYETEDFCPVGTTICGDKMSESEFLKFTSFLPRNYKHLYIYNINVEWRNKLYVIEWRDSKFPSQGFQISFTD